MTCQCSVGLLVLRECGEPAIGTCSFCSRALCAMHRTLGPGPGGEACPECASTQAGYMETPETEAAAQRKKYYDEYGDQTPHDAARFSEADRQALRRRQSQSYKET